MKHWLQPANFSLTIPPPSQVSISPNVHFFWQHRYFSAHFWCCGKISIFAKEQSRQSRIVAPSPRLSIGFKRRTIFKFKFTTNFKDVFQDGQTPSKKVRQ